MQKSKKNFTEGKIFFRITAFTLPIIATGILQILYNMADTIVIGSFSGDPNAVAAVGSTTSLYHLILNLILGTSAGAGILVAQRFGGGYQKEISDAVHTSMAFSVVAGIVVGLLGLVVTPFALQWMKIKPEIIESSILYIRIICLGIPASAIYNFGAAFRSISSITCWS